MNEIVEFEIRSLPFARVIIFMYKKCFSLSVTSEKVVKFSYLNRKQNSILLGVTFLFVSLLLISGCYFLCVFLSGVLFFL